MFFTLLLIFFLGACGGGGGGGSDADAGMEEEAGPEEESEADLAGGEDLQGDDPVEIDVPLPQPLDRALLIDADLLHHSAWIDLHDAAVETGIVLDYRRFYPHVTAQDTAGDGRYPLIMIAAGSAPGMASSRLSVEEIEGIAAFIRDGGVLMLMPQPTRLDSVYGENDWYVMNRILETAGSSMRVERGSLLGPLYLGSPDPPHLDSDTGYATLLEFDIGYAWAFPNPDVQLAAVLDGPVPAGRATVLRTAGAGPEVLLFAHRGANLWIRTGGSTIGEQIRSIIDARPVAAVEKVGEGFLAVVPRFMATLGGAGGQISEHPALSTETIGRNAVLLRWLLDHLRSLHEGGVELTPSDPSGGTDDLFWVSTPSIHPAGEGEVIPVVYEPSARVVAPSPPSGDLLEDFAAIDTGAPPPPSPLFRTAKGKIGYGGMPWDPDLARTVFSEAADMGLDAIVGGFTPERLVTGELTPVEAAAMRDAMAQLGDIALSEGMKWLVGGYYTGHVYNSNPSIFPKSIGAQRQTYDAPPLLHQPLWDDYLIPAAREVAAASAAHEGIAGILIDMEMYGTALFYTDAQAFDDTTFEAFLSTVTDTAVEELLRSQPVDTRLDALIESGLLKDFFSVLHEKAAETGRRYREAAADLDPDFTVALYFPGFPTCWQYRGLMEGLGSEGSPVLVLTYDPYSHPARADMAAGGAFAVHLGGAILSHFPPEDLTGVLENCGEFTDGFWYYSHDEISRNAAVDPVFGTTLEYRQAITLAAGEW